ncbi:hypothetical protein C3L33_02704, partial [Rhododendron williamsianum]
MSIDQGTFESLVPSRFTTFTFPNPSSSSLSPNPLHTPLLRVAVLDSPTQPITPLIAAMLVPTHRESDWTFSTHSGHLLLLLASHHHHHISRLILIDDLIRSAVVDTCVGSCVGEMSVEDVELEGRGFRRRLRFKRMPNLIQTQVKIVPIDRSSDVGFAGLGDLGLFRLDMGSLVQPYLGPMVAGLSLGFEVVGVEADEVVLTVARKYFGLRESKFVRVCVGDGIRLVQQIAGRGENANCDSLSDCFGVKLDSIFDVIMVDLDSSDARMGTMAPPLEFVEKSVLRAARLVVSDHGILVINVIPPSRSFYEKLLGVSTCKIDENILGSDVFHGKGIWRARVRRAIAKQAWFDVPFWANVTCFWRLEKEYKEVMEAMAGSRKRSGSLIVTAIIFVGDDLHRWIGFKVREAHMKDFSDVEPERDHERGHGGVTM